MYCANCGAQSDGPFCPNCGAPTTNNNQQQNNQNNFNGYDQSFNQGHDPNYNQSYDQSCDPNMNSVYDPSFNNNINNNNSINPPKKSNSVLIAVIAVAAVVIVGLVATIIVFASKKPANNANAESTSAVTTTEASQPESEFNVNENKSDNTSSDSSIVQPDFSYKTTVCYVTADVGLILRRGPGKGYDKIYTIKYSQSVTVLGGTDSVSNFVYVEHSGTKGWVCSDYLSSTKPTKSYNTNSGYSISDYYSVSSWTTSVKPAKGLNIRSGATTSSYSYTVLRQGASVTVLGVSAYNDDWYYVKAYQGGRTYYGFVSGAYLY